MQNHFIPVQRYNIVYKHVIIQQTNYLLRMRAKFDRRVRKSIKRSGAALGLEYGYSTDSPAGMPSFCFYKMFNNCCSIVFLKLLCALMSVSILAFPIVAQRVSNRPSPVRSQLRYNALSIDCQNVTEIVFVGFFPCLRGSSFEAPKNISECDLLAEAAAHLAVERVNQDPTVLPNITLSLHPIYSSTDKVLLKACVIVCFH